MATERNTLKLGDLGKIVTGKTPSKKVEGAFGSEIPFVTPRDMNGCRSVDRTERSLTEIGAQSVRNSIVPPHSVAVSCIGSDMGKAVIIPQRSVTNQQINTIVVSNEFDYKYVYYDLSVRKEEIRNAAGGSAQPILNKSHFSDLEITIPPLPEQKAIAHILGTLDDKIEANRRINATLEAMAQALFKSWFVDFDPVIDNALTAGNPIPEELHPRAEIRRRALKDDTANREIAKLFPNSFEETVPMEWIPKGWEARPLYETAKFINGSAFKSRDFSRDGDGSPIVKIAELKNGISAQTKFTTEEFPEKYRIDNGEMLYSWSGSPETSLEVFKWFGGPGWLNQHIFKICTDSAPQKHFVYYLLKELKPQLIAIATNKQTTGLGHVTVADMKRLKVPYPDNGVLAAFSKIAGKYYESSTVNDLQTQTLTKLRDTLLPKLISGELRISEVKQSTTR